MLEIIGVRASYGPIEALRGVDLTIEQGEIVSLIGANGAGKTTLLMTIFGEPRATAGRIVFQDEDITQAPTHSLIDRGIAQSPEGRRIFPQMTVLENLQLGALRLRPHRLFKPTLDMVFDLFPRLKERREQRGGTLSGGEQEMLSMARALMTRPRMLLLDEPSLGLAPLVAKQIFSSIRDINCAEGVTIFLVEQNIYRALGLAHRGYVMANGAIVASGSGRALLHDPKIRAAYLEGGVVEEGASH